MELKPNHGLLWTNDPRKVLFNMNPSQVKDCMGIHYCWQEWMDHLDNALYYGSVVFIFDKSNKYGPLEDGRLVEIWINGKNDTIRLGGVPINALTSNQFEEMLNEANIDYVLREGQEYFVKDWNLDIAFEKSNVYQIWAYHPTFYKK